jgi:hypothetical protein
VQVDRSSVGDRLEIAVALHVPYQALKSSIFTLALKDLLQCARTFCGCELSGRADAWTKGQRDKMLLRSILSARIQDDPNSSLSYIWGQSGSPRDINSNEFPWAAEFIREFFK